MYDKSILSRVYQSPDRGVPVLAESTLSAGFPGRAPPAGGLGRTHGPRCRPAGAPPSRITCRSARSSESAPTVRRGDRRQARARPGWTNVRENPWPK